MECYSMCKEVKILYLTKIKFSRKQIESNVLSL